MPLLSCCDWCYWSPSVSSWESKYKVSWQSCKIALGYDASGESKQKKKAASLKSLNHNCYRCRSFFCCMSVCICHFSAGLFQLMFIFWQCVSVWLIVMSFEIDKVTKTVWALIIISALLLAVSAKTVSSWNCISLVCVTCDCSRSVMQLFSVKLL